MNTNRVARNMVKFQQKQELSDRGQKRFSLVTSSRTLDYNYNYAETNTGALCESDRLDSLNQANKLAKRCTSICHGCGAFDRHWVNKSKILARKIMKYHAHNIPILQRRLLYTGNRDKQNRRKRPIVAEIFFFDHSGM